MQVRSHLASRGLTRCVAGVRVGLPARWAPPFRRHYPCCCCCCPLTAVLQCRRRVPTPSHSSRCGLGQRSLCSGGGWSLFEFCSICARHSPRLLTLGGLSAVPSASNDAKNFQRSSLRCNVASQPREVSSSYACCCCCYCCCQLLLQALIPQHLQQHDPEAANAVLAVGCRGS
jgi:hypothetical protein